MRTKMKKGILKPIRYLSNMFDGKEPEMQIGFPTDVKHVAHIGWDGPNVSNSGGAPSWMKDYHSAPLNSSSFRSDSGDSHLNSNPWASQEIVLGDSFRSETGSIDTGGPGSPAAAAARTRRSRRHQSSGSSSSSIGCTAADVPPSDKPPEKEKKSKKSGIRKNRMKDKDRSLDNVGASPSGLQEPPTVPKKSTRRKNKAGSGGGGAAPAASEAAPAEATGLPVVMEEKDPEL